VTPLGDTTGDGVSIRSELPADIEGIYAVHSASFPTVAEAALVNALRAAGQLSISLVAVERDQLIGHIGFSPISVDGVPVGLGLAPVAVQLAYRQRGVAARLIRHGLQLCREAGTGLVVVLGDPRYYHRFGFEPARRLALRDEYKGGDAFQALELVRGSVPSGGGLVRYSPAFAAVGV
jgi:putative acetyltransferase